MTDDTVHKLRPPSGRFVLRIDPGLHASLREAARAAGTSLNEYCARKLASSAVRADEAVSGVVERATSVLRDSLLGIVVFGSWARGEHAARSDVDVLVIPEKSVEITRELYRRWDAGPGLSWHGHPVEPHFARLPPEPVGISGLWAEVALDGLVLFERDFVVSRRLSGLRRTILAGRISRRLAQGRPYWVRAG